VTMEDVNELCAEINWLSMHVGEIHKRLSEMEGENKRLREALTAMLAENGALHVNSINSDSPAEKLARAALEALGKGGGE